MTFSLIGGQAADCRAAKSLLHLALLWPRRHRSDVLSPHGGSTGKYRYDQLAASLLDVDRLFLTALLRGIAQYLRPTREQPQVRGSNPSPCTRRKIEGIDKQGEAGILQA